MKKTASQAKKTPLKSDTRLTIGHFDKIMETLDKKFDSIDRRFESIDKKFDSMERRFIDLDEKWQGNFTRMYNHVEQLRSDMNNRFEKVDEKFSQIFGLLDASLKRTDNNKLEIDALGNQHDDLAKYCTTKIGYPTYGRNL